MVEELFSLLASLTEIHGPSGQELAVAEQIIDQAGPYVDEFRMDRMGNLIMHKKGDGPKLLFDAHMDTVGLIVTYLEEDGSIRVGKLGGVNPKSIVHTQVRFKNGIYGAVKVHGKAEEKELAITDLYLDIGARNREEAEKLVQVGDTVVYAGACRKNAYRVISPYLDNRISCAVLMKVMERIQGSKNDLYFVFAAQEEVGLRGAKTAAYGVSPDYAVAVDITGAFDWPGAPKINSSALGEGAAIRVMDASVICHPAMVELLTNLAKEHEIPYQLEVNTRGGTDGGPIHQTRNGVITGGVCIPCRYTHTPTESIDIRDALACVDLLTALAGCKLPTITEHLF